MTLFPRRDEHGFVLSTRLLALSVSAVAMAGLVFLANDPDEVGGLDQAATPATAQPKGQSHGQPTATPSPSPSASAKPRAPKPKPEPIRRGETFVSIFNNTGVTGLAGGVAGTAEAAGWNIVGTDNWYGTVDGTAVYYPPQLEREAELLSQELGLNRTKKAVEPMQFDRLTVILTDDYQG